MTEEPEYAATAIVSLVLGLLFFIPFTSITAIIFGFVALSDIKRTGKQGKDMAQWGVGLGFAFFFIKVIALLIVFSLSVFTGGAIAGP